MIRIMRMRFPIYMGIWPAIYSNKNAEDEPDQNLYSKYHNEDETGLDRLKQMFTLSAYKEPSREVVQILQGTMLAGAAGLFVGGFLNSKYSADNFVKQNMATQFSDARDAKRQLQSKVVLDFGRGAFGWAVKLSTFCFVFISTSTMISVYRGETSVWEYLIAGIVSGSMMKLWSGPKAMIVGAGLGSALGVVGGLMTMSLLKATGTTMEEIRIWQYDWRKWRQDKFHDVMKDYRAREDQTEINKLLRKYDQDQKAE